MKPTHGLLQGMPYTRSDQMGEDYLKRKFARVRKQLLDAAKQKEAESQNPSSVIKAFVMRAK